MSNRLLISAVALVVFAALVAGCGSDEDRPTKAAFIVQADAVCSKADKTQEIELSKFSKENPKAAATKEGKEDVIINVGLAPISTEAEELSELVPPEGDDEFMEEFVEGIEKAVVVVEGNPFIMAQSEAPFDKVDKMATDYGFKACAEIT